MAKKKLPRKGGPYLGHYGVSGFVPPADQNRSAALITAPAVPDDQWRHRALNMRCRSCIFFVLKGPGPLGRCRRHAPTLSGWPAVFTQDWCGDHKLDETKL